MYTAVEEHHQQQENSGHYFTGPAAVNLDTGGTLVGDANNTSVR
jgi:hypothetical protein